MKTIEIQNVTTEYNKLTQKDITDLRLKIDEKAFEKSYFKTWFWLLFDLTFFVIFMLALLKSSHWYNIILFAVLAGIAASGMFVLAHDAAHGSLFKNKWVAECVGTIFMLPALNSYRLWCFGHNRIHHGFTSFTPIDWIWKPLSIDEYNKLGVLGKIEYRIERSLFGSGLHYIVKVWWSKMVMFVPPDLQESKQRAIRIGKLIVVVYMLIIMAIFYHFNGIFAAICAVLIPFIVFNYVISIIIYLHHTHPQIPFFDERAEWNHTIGAVFCTTVIHTNWLVDKFITHDILIHTPHHADIRIPFYRLTTALRSIKQNYSEYIHEYKLTLPTLFYIFKSCKLYDYKKHVWYNFKVLKSVLTKDAKHV
jgi:omega-6 fatty acid desaturase (delta-12 desaturase)